MRHAGGCLLYGSISLAIYVDAFILILRGAGALRSQRNLFGAGEAAV